MDKPTDLIPATEAAKIARRSARTLKRWALAGVITAYRFPHLKASASFYSRREVEALMRPAASARPASKMGG